MTLRTAHIILISAGLSLGLLFTLWSLHRYSDSGSAAQLVIGVVTGVGTTALGLYLRAFIKKGRS